MADCIFIPDKRTKADLAHGHFLAQPGRGVLVAVPRSLTFSVSQNLTVKICN